MQRLISSLNLAAPFHRDRRAQTHGRQRQHDQSPSRHRGNWPGSTSGSYQLNVALAGVRCDTDAVAGAIVDAGAVRRGATWIGPTDITNARIRGHTRAVTGALVDAAAITELNMEVVQCDGLENAIAGNRAPRQQAIESGGVIKPQYGPHFEKWRAPDGA